MKRFYFSFDKFWWGYALLAWYLICALYRQSFNILYLTLPEDMYIMLLYFIPIIILFGSIRIIKELI